MTIAAEPCSPALAPVVSTALGVDAAVENLRALTGGASRSTWAFDAVTPEERRALILRIGPPDDVHASMELEARVQAVAAAAGTPVPHVLVADNFAAALGNPFLILRRGRRRADCPAHRTSSSEKAWRADRPVPVAQPVCAGAGRHPPSRRG